MATDFPVLEAVMQAVDALEKIKAFGCDHKQYSVLMPNCGSLKNKCQACLASDALTRLEKTARGSVVNFSI